MTVTRHHFDWNHTRAFLAAAEEGSLSAAARALGLSQPTLSRQVSALEEELGVTLFERTGRQLTLTESGLALLNYAKSMGDAAVSLSNAATGQDDRLEGTVCISTTELVAAHIMPDILRSLHAAAPGITLELVASNQASDLRRREADIAIRTFRPQQPDFIARQLTPAQGALFASRQYILEFGDLQTSASLSQARF
ncbi:MAG: LysR family transcriptional regulator, partial [Pseudomonadales bacterium]|nr:LysR family transcriptional regulator [Pseudomonadales bacterium]